MRKILITMMAIAFSLSAWSTQVTKIDTVEVGDPAQSSRALLHTLCIDGYKYIYYDAFDSGSFTQMFERYGATSIPIECSMD